MYKSLTTILHEPARVSYIIPGYKTGYPTLDSGLGGISDSELVLIAAKTGNRSSNLMLNLAVGLSLRYHVLLISTAKGAPAVAREFKSVLHPCNETSESDTDAMYELNRLAANIFIEADARFMEEIDQSIARFRTEYPADAIVLIDDLNNIFLSREIRTYPRPAEDREIVANLKMLTLKYNTPIVLLAKIGYSDHHKKNDPPSLCDLDHLMGVGLPI
jgi:replicative DNA helicase